MRVLTFEDRGADPTTSSGRVRVGSTGPTRPESASGEVRLGWVLLTVPYLGFRAGPRAVLLVCDPSCRVLPSDRSVPRVPLGPSLRC